MSGLSCLWEGKRFVLRYALASQFWRAIPTWWADRAWQRRGDRLLSRAARSVPACATLLHAFEPLVGQQASPSAVAPASRLLWQLQTSRGSYVEVFTPELRGRQGWQQQVVAFDRLAPHGQENNSWPRSSDELRILRDQLVGLLMDWFDAHQRRILLLVKLSEAGWSSNRRIAQALQEAIVLGHLRASVVDCSADTNQPDPTAGHLVQQFDCCVVLCRAAEVVEQAKRYSGASCRLGVVAFGEVSADQRAAMPTGVTVCSVWGADEVGPLIALETPLTRLVAAACHSNADLRRTVCPDAHAVIGLYQPFPVGPWVEQQGTDLLVSSWGALPLLRYRPGQSGRLIRYGEMCRWLLRCDVQSARQVRRLTRMGSACWKLPVVMLTDA